MTITFPTVSDQARQAFKLNSNEAIIELGEMLMTKIASRVEVMHFGKMCEGTIKEVTQDEHCFIIRTELDKSELSDWDGNMSTENTHMINKLDNRGLSTINFK